MAHIITNLSESQERNYEFILNYDTWKQGSLELKKLLYDKNECFDVIVKPRLQYFKLCLLLTVTIESKTNALSKKYKSVEISLIIEDLFIGTILSEQVWTEEILSDQLINVSTQLPSVALINLPETLSLKFNLKFKSTIPTNHASPHTLNTSTYPEEKLECLEKKPTYPEIVLSTNTIESLPNIQNNENSLLWSVDDFSDLLIECKDGSVLKVHQSVMFSKCPSLKAAFKENYSGNARKMKFVNMEPRVVKEMIRFIYTDELGDVDEIEIDMIECAQKLELVGLADACIERLQTKLSCATVVDTLIFAQQNDFKQLKDISLRFIVTNLEETRQHETFMVLEKHPELLIEILCHINK